MLAPTLQRLLQLALRDKMVPLHQHLPRQRQSPCIIRGFLFLGVWKAVREAGRRTAEAINPMPSTTVSPPMQDQTAEPDAVSPVAKTTPPAAPSSSPDIRRSQVTCSPSRLSVVPASRCDASCEHQRVMRTRCVPSLVTPGRRERHSQPLNPMYVGKCPGERPRSESDWGVGRDDRQDPRAGSVAKGDRAREAAGILLVLLLAHDGDGHGVDFEHPP